MDEIFSKDKLQIIIPILFGTIYFSAFKNGKQTAKNRKKHLII